MNHSEAYALQGTRQTRRLVKASFSLKKPSPEKGVISSLDEFLVEHLQNNLSQLESKIQFFSFAIQEIEDVTKNYRS